MRKRKELRKAAYFGLILILVLVLLFSGLQILESTVFLKEQPVEPTRASKTITRNGIDYFPRQDITVIMALGIGSRGPLVSSGYYRNSGEADAIVLLILDDADKTYSVLCLNRDSMVNMPALGLGGKSAGTVFGQLALSYTYGEGLEDSCENAKKAISDLLNGISIDHYVAMSMDAIALINDGVGGVTVNVTEDFSQVDASIPMGKVTLNGSQALSYVQSRMNVGNQLNISRMGRHEEYMQGLMNALDAKVASGESFVVNLYEEVSPYMVTDCSVNTISGLLNRCSEYTLKEIVSPEGDNVQGEEYYEFYIDAEKLDALTLRLFYAPKK